MTEEKTEVKTILSYPISIRWKPPARDDFKVYVNSTSDIKKLINETSAGEE